MTHNSKNRCNFLNTLLSLNDHTSNPFLIASIKNKGKKDRYNYPFGSYEDSLKIEVRCPICLGRVHDASKPLYCIHIFCFNCLKKWYKNASKCPICRADICSIIRIDINEFYSTSQMDLHI